jgi:NitT/TauT family transport system substrate-binding protein
MKKILLVLLLAALSTGFLLTGCSNTALSTSAPQEVTTSTGSSAVAATAASTTVQAESTTPVETGKLVIYAPASSSSIPVLLAASQMKNTEVKLYTDQSQANTLFLRGDVSILVTGLSVGVDLYKNGAPVQEVNSFVSGLSYLVTYGKSVTSLADLKGQQIYLPFEGSPIEEVITFLAGKAGLKYKEDLSPIYSAFDSSVQLLKEGKATAVVLPEPNVSLVEGQPNIYISLSLYDEWNKVTGTNAGYPQVGSFVNSNWAKSHSDEIAAFNQALSSAITSVEKDPAAAVDSVKANYKLSPALLLKSLNRTHYTLMTGQAMEDSISNYYQVIGKPLDEKFSAFYYLPAQ